MGRKPKKRVFLLKDPCLVRGAPATLWSYTALDVWSASVIRYLIYFHCYQLYLLARELVFAILDVIPMSPWK